MKIQTEELLLFVEPNSDAETQNDSPLNFFLVNKKHQWYCNSSSQIRIGEVEVEFPVPEKIGEDALVTHAINTLRERQQKIRDDAARDLAKIEEEIAKLALLTYNPDGVVIED